MNLITLKNLNINMDNSTITLSPAEHNYMCSLPYKEYYFGSFLFKTNTENSDKDLVRIYKPITAHQNNVYKYEESGVVTVLWVTESEFKNQLVKCNSTIFLDVAIFNKLHFSGNPRNYKTIKSYLGVAKRDVTIHSSKKKTFHALRNLTIAKKLIFRRNFNVNFINMKDFIYSLNDEELNSYRKTILNECAGLREKIKNQLNNGYIQLNWFEK